MFEVSESLHCLQIIIIEFNSFGSVYLFKHHQPCQFTDTNEVTLKKMSIC